MRIRKFLKQIIIISTLFLLANASIAQSQDVNALHETARSFMRQGDFENAQLVLDKALTIAPDNLDLLKDQAFVDYLKRDFSGSIEVGKKITARPDADVQSFQILGLAYKAIAMDKERDKMYKDALKKFPSSGVLYSEYGELLSSAGNAAAAIKEWEKGIETDANYSGNYYYASKYYAVKGNAIWGLLYGEIFINIESLSKRTEEIKTLIYTGYQKLFTDLSALDAARKTGTPFEKNVADNFQKLSSIMYQGVTPESLTAFRARFVLNWYNSEGKKYPFRLFEHYRQLLQDGYFESYNQWLCGPIIDSKKYSIWVQNHSDDVKSFQQFQRNVLFKIPGGQYYPHTVN
ncbi:MAG TPA: hypothetical protein PKM63_01750 [Panacibacter sp.]|nr:hypothetical protein [Panacibacter sp.]HNP42979.1 hypothetical protein [Panacibacter sp.]